MFPDIGDQSELKVSPIKKRVYVTGPTYILTDPIIYIIL